MGFSPSAAPQSPAPTAGFPRFLHNISVGLALVEKAAIWLSALGLAGVLLVDLVGGLLMNAGLSIDGETLGHLPEYAMFLMVWVGGFGASAAVRSRMHLTLGSPLKRVWLRKIQELTCVGLCTALTVVMVQYLKIDWEMMLFHKRMAMIGLTICGGLMSLRYLLQVLGADPPVPRDEPTP